VTTICCKCGRHFWPGKGKCPGRPQRHETEATGCNHDPCMNCVRYKEKK
jgi:hypothetical protein